MYELESNNNIEEQMRQCSLCPRACGVNRTKGQKGVCNQTAAVRIARAALHMWEEPCISGEKGSGAVFFCGCALHCVFCQNYNIAVGETGQEITIERLSEIFLQLQEKQANNINLVTAGQFVPQVRAALIQAKRQGLVIPVVYNTSAYESVETLKQLDGLVDVYLPDLKYVDEQLSLEFSHARDYFARASAAIAEMVRQTKTLEFTDEATRCERLTVEEYQRRSDTESLIMTRGVIVRHLLLPGCAWDSKQVIQYLLETYDNRIFISIMNQYTPLAQVAEHPLLGSKVTETEYDEVVDYAIACGIENGFIQEGDVAKESFIPDFEEGEGI